MAYPEIVNVSRRRFVAAGLAAGAGLTLGVRLADAAPAGPGQAGGEVVGTTTFEPNAFVRIATDGTVTVFSKHLEMGQGAYTGLATLVAEELDADWSQVRVEGAPADASRYNNLFWGAAQGTGGSTAIANSFAQLRKAGAAARQMLVAAAAERWGVAASEIRVADGVLSHGTQRAEFGELAAQAAAMPVPEEPVLKDPAAFRLIGREQLPRKDTPSKVDGSAQYTQDVKLAGMLTAVVAHPPLFGAKVASFDAAASLKVPGVEQVVEIPSGVAVLARDFWSAKRGRDALSVQWDDFEAYRGGSDQMFAEYAKLAESPGLVAASAGDVDAALSGAVTVLRRDIRFPYLAHAAMEPMNCVVQLTAGKAEIWNGEQMHTGDQHAVAAVAGIAPEAVKIHTLYAGGSFGRRANPSADYVLEATQIAKVAKTERPVKLVWTREDDMRAGWYRPAFFHRIEAGLDTAGNPVGWRHVLVGQSIAAGTAFEGVMIKDGVDTLSVEGAANMPYAIPARRFELHSPESPVPVQWWRSVGSTHTAFAVETMIDALANAAGRDPIAFRQRLLTDHPRHRAVMMLAATKAGWDRPLPPGRARGIAVHESFQSYVAQVAEVTVDGGRFTVDRVVIAVDCGIAVNPDIVRAQMEGGMAFGLAPALTSAITLTNGQVDQSNFHDYQVLRIDQMPDVEVHIVPSAEAPTGVGEPGTPPIAPAVANALTAATGRSFDRLPLQLS